MTVSYQGPSFLRSICQNWNCKIFDRVTELELKRIGDFDPKILLEFSALECLSIEDPYGERPEIIAETNKLFENRPDFEKWDAGQQFYRSSEQWSCWIRKGSQPSNRTIALISQK